MQHCLPPRRIRLNELRGVDKEDLEYSFFCVFSLVLGIDRDSMESNSERSY